MYKRQVYGGDGNDVIDTQRGDDRIFGGNGSDVIYAGQDNDTLLDIFGEDRLYGGLGNDLLSAGFDPLGLATTNLNEEDFLFGGYGDDTLYLGSDDQGAGGRDGDTFVIMPVPAGGVASTITDFGNGSDTLTLVVTDPSAASAANYVFTAGTSSNGVAATIISNAAGQALVEVENATLTFSNLQFMSVAQASTNLANAAGVTLPTLPT